jgi:hypothetical protein
MDFTLDWWRYVIVGGAIVLGASSLAHYLIYRLMAGNFDPSASHSNESIRQDAELIRLHVANTYLAEVGKFDINELTEEEGAEYLRRLRAAYGKELS